MKKILLFLLLTGCFTIPNNTLLETKIEPNEFQKVEKLDLYRNFYYNRTIYPYLYQYQDLYYRHNYYFDYYRREIVIHEYPIFIQKEIKKDSSDEVKVNKELKIDTDNKNYPKKVRR